MNIHRYLAALLLIAPALALTQPSLAQSSKPNLNQRLTMQAKPAVVRIVNQCYGSYRYAYADFRHLKEEDQWKLLGEEVEWGLPSFIGTGFFINHKGYIVTSARVIEEDECKERLVKNLLVRVSDPLNIPSRGEEFKKEVKERIEKNLVTNNDYVGVVILPNPEVKPLSFSINHSGREHGNNVKRISKDIAIIKVAIKNAFALMLGDSDQVEIADDVITIGYPEEDIYLELKGIISDESFYEANVTEGSISNPNKKLKGGNPVLQVGFVAEKQVSLGSPVLNKDGQVIGMISFEPDKDGKPVGNPWVIPSIKLWEFIRQSGATNEQGEVSKLYQSGLEQYWNGDYRGAKEKFDQVKRLSPHHSEVERLLIDIENRLLKEWVNPLKNPTYLLLLALVAGGGVVAAVTYFLLRYQSSARKASLKKNGFGSTQNWLELECQGQIRRFLLDKEEHRLGRDSKWSDLHIPDDWEVVSRHHAILRKEGEDYRIYDGDGTVPSRNGLWLDDDSRVDPRDGYHLENGDQLKIGKDPHEQVVLTYFNPTTNQVEVKETKMAD